MTSKTIEIYYDIDAIPGKPSRIDAPDFRNAAMEHIEDAMTKAGVGEWVGAEIGGGEINFGFEVEDFDRAEAIVRAAVKGTRYDCIREIERHEMTEEELAAAAEAANAPIPLRFKLMLALSLPFAILFVLFRILTLPLRMIARRG